MGGFDGVEDGRSDASSTARMVRTKSLQSLVLAHEDPYNEDGRISPRRRPRDLTTMPAGGAKQHNITHGNPRHHAPGGA